MATIQLVAAPDNLYFPPTVLSDYDKMDKAAGTFDENRKVGPILLFRYPEGDCDLVQEDERYPAGERLAHCINDAIEQGWIDQMDVVLLPDGEQC